MSSTVAPPLGPEVRSEPAEPAFMPRPASRPSLFLPDCEDSDTLGRAGAAAHLAGLLAHPQAGTPFMIGVTGSAGSGKSSFLGLMLDRLDQAAGGGQSGSRLERISTVRVDASAGLDASSAVLSRLLPALGHKYPHLAEEALYAGGDPLKMARAAGERLNDARRQLDSERQSLQELGGRRARLADTVLFNSPGSQIESYARQNRSRIEGRLRSFGIASADPVVTFKELVREASENGSGGSRMAIAMRALWGFRGQGTLIVLAVLLLIVGWGSAVLADNQDTWLTWLRSFGDNTTGLSNWAQAHADWLGPTSHAAFALALLMILVVIVRTIRFLQPVFRGATLFSADLDERRRDLDSSLAHQTRRVDHLSGEVDAAVKTADAAERRVEARKAAGQLNPVLSLADRPAGGSEMAEAIMAGLSDAMTSAAEAETPQRIVVAIDELDRLPARAAAEFLDCAQRLLRRPHFAAVAAFDRHHVLSGFSETDPSLAAAQLGRCVQLSYDLDADDAALSQPSPATEVPTSRLDQPWTAAETRLAEALMVYAGPNPRTIKRFINSFRVARADPKLTGATNAELAALAVGLALDGNGAAAELGRYRDGIAGPESQAGSASLLGQALAAAQEVIGEHFTAAEARRGLDVARLYSRYS